jgi:hypothetical protein
MFARRQFEHGARLSQRTLRLRHTTQLRGFGVASLRPEASNLALFSASEADANAPGVSSTPVLGIPCDILAGGLAKLLQSAIKPGGILL